MIVLRSGNNPFSCLFLFLGGIFFLSLIILFLPVILPVLLLYAIFARSSLQSTYSKFRNQTRAYPGRKNEGIHRENGTFHDNDTVDVEYTVLNEQKMIADDDKGNE